MSATCLVCKIVIKGAVGVTSNFITHYRRKHPASFQLYAAEKNNVTNSKKKTESKQAVFDKKVLSFIADCMLPLSIVEKKTFKQLFIGTGLKVLSRPSIVKLMNDERNVMVSSIKKIMENVKYVCTTADIWSGNKRSFFGYTIHWIDEQYVRQSAALACRRFSGSHTSEKIAEMIGFIHEEYGLDQNKVVATVTDNASNFIKAFKDFGVELHDADEEFLVENIVEPILPKHVRCGSHTLNLLSTTDFLNFLKTDQNLYERHSNAFKTCNRLWKKAKFSKSSEIISETLGEALSLPVVTRWNSLYDSVKKILLNQSKVNEACTKISIPKFSERSFLYLKEYCEMMEPVANTLDHLQSDNIFFGDLIPALVSLRNKIRKFYKYKNPQILKEAAVNLETSLINRFKNYFLLKPEAHEAMIAAILRPNLKLKWFKAIEDLEHNHNLTTVTEIILDYLRKAQPDDLEIHEQNTQDQASNFYDFEADEGQLFLFLIFIDFSPLFFFNIHRRFF